MEELRRISSETGIVAWYPDYLALELTDALGGFLGIDANSILTFPGSDVGLETLCRTFLDPEDHVAALCPTYENFFVYALQTGAHLHKVDLPKPFRVDLDWLVGHLEKLPELKCIYLSSPNNPCGYVLPIEITRAIADRFPRSIVVVDEAYIEFADAASAAALLPHCPNVVIARTFSKAFGLAGVRLGYLCAGHEVLNSINKIRNGKNISMISQRLGIYALRNLNKLHAWVHEVREARGRFCAWLTARSIPHYESQGNFVLLEVSDPASVCSRLKAQGIYVRNRHALLPQCIRITIGSKAQTARVIAALDALGIGRAPG